MQENWAVIALLKVSDEHQRLTNNKLILQRTAKLLFGKQTPHVKVMCYLRS